MIAPRLHAVSECGSYDNAVELDELKWAWSEASNCAERNDWPEDLTLRADMLWRAYNDRKIDLTGRDAYGHAPEDYDNGNS